MPSQDNDKNKRVSEPFAPESHFVSLFKPAWHKLTDSALFKKCRHSFLNPFHTFLKDIKADTLEEARERAIQEKLRFFEYNGIRASTDEPYLIPLEAGKRERIFRNGRNALEVIPKNSHGIPDLTAEEPIVIAIIPVEGPSLVGHVAMQYKDKVINRMHYNMGNDALFPLYGKNADYYFVYPSKLGIDEKQLMDAIDRTNVKKNGFYNLFSNNCAGAVDYALRLVGVKDLDQFGPDDLGLTVPIPGNNPFGKGIQEWCRRHGVHVFSSEVEMVYKYNNIASSHEQFLQYKETHDRYQRYKAQMRKSNSIIKRAHERVIALIRRQTNSNDAQQVQNKSNQVKKHLNFNNDYQR